MMKEVQYISMRGDLNHVRIDKTSNFARMKKTEYWVLDGNAYKSLDSSGPK